ncbi:putative ribonuclease H-like domain-containing protein [Tanacetum coccineum]
MAPRAVLMKTGLRPLNTARPVNTVHLQKEDQCYVDSGCSRHMTGNMSYLSDFKEFDRGYVTFGGRAKGGKITGKRTLKTGKLDFEDVYFVKELGRTPALSFMRPFGCHVTFLYTLDYLGKFDEKSDEGFFVGYSMNSKDFRVYNIRTRKVEENLHIMFLEDKPIITGDGPKWLFDIDVLTKSMNYVPVVAGTNSNDFVGTEESIGTGHSSKETGSIQNYILMPLWKDGLLFDSSSKNDSNDEPQPPSDAGKKDDEGVCNESGIADHERPENSTQGVNTARPSINTEPYMFSMGDNATLEVTHADLFGGETEVNLSNITTTYPVPSTPNTRIHKDHSLDHVIGDVQSGVQTRRMTKTTNEQGFISAVYEGKTHEDLHTCLFACFLSQVEPKKVIQALTDPSWIEAMQDELLQNKKNERGIVIRNKARLMDVKSAFLYGKIEEEVYVCQPLGFKDPEFPDRVYKVEKALYGLHQAPRAWNETLSTYLLKNRFHRGTIDKTLFIKKVKGDILLVQVYVDDIIFGSTKKELCTEFKKLMHKKFQMSSMGKLTFFLGFTPMETSKLLLKDAEAEDVDVHLYRSMIGSLMYLTTYRPDIIFAVCGCARFQVTPKGSHLHAVKRIFRYLKGHPKLGLWYPKDSPLDLEAYSDSDYAGASLDKNPQQEVLWIQNQMLDYGYNFMNTKIFIDNESTICIVKNPVFHSKTKHIKIRHHFIRDSYEKRLIQVIKIHTDHNVADLLTKELDVSQIVDFLNASPIRYASTISPTVYVSYIEQFMSTAKIKTVNKETQIPAKVDGKTIVITESSVRRDLHFNDVDGITFLTNTEIFENLQLMGTGKNELLEAAGMVMMAVGDGVRCGGVDGGCGVAAAERGGMSGCMYGEQ